MFSFPKLLKISYFLLLLVTVGELIYFFFIQSKKMDVSLTSNTERVVALPTISLNNKQTLQQSRAESAIDAFNAEHIWGKKGLLTSSILEDHYKGIISDLDTKGGIFPENKFPYKAKIILKGTEGFSQIFLFHEATVSLAEIVALKDNIETPIMITDLKIGDQVVIDRKIDLTKGYGKNFIKLKISKIL